MIVVEQNIKTKMSAYDAALAVSEASNHEQAKFFSKLGGIMSGRVYDKQIKNIAKSNKVTNRKNLIEFLDAFSNELKKIK